MMIILLNKFRKGLRLYLVPLMLKGNLTGVFIGMLIKFFLRSFSNLYFRILTVQRCDAASFNPFFLA